MPVIKYSKLWEDNYSARVPRYTMLGNLIPTTPPVASVVCLCTNVDDIRRPLKTSYNVFINWETGLFHHKDCDKPLSGMVQDCNGCFEDFWGYSFHLACTECKPYM